MNEALLSHTPAQRPPSALRQEWLFYGAMLVVLLLPLAFLSTEEPLTSPVRHIDIRTHAGVEMFCGVIALLVGGLILTLRQHYHERGLGWFVVAFCCMGMFDLWHAAIHPVLHPGLFVATHTLSTLSGSVLLCVGAAHYYRAHRPTDFPQRLPRNPWLIAGALVGIAAAYHLALPAGQADGLYGFTDLARRAHELAGLLYVATALLALLLYRATGQRLALMVAGMLLLFAQSAYLFRFSHLWDITWWTWHIVKAAFYTGTLVALAAGLVVALRAVERARAAQAVSNRELQKTHTALARVHHELQIRNNMVSASVGARGLEQTLALIESALTEFLGPSQYELTLHVRADETGEWQRELERQTLRWSVRVSAEEMPCVHLERSVGGTGDGLVHMCTPLNRPYGCMCLALRAHDQLFGYIRPRIQDMRRIRAHRELLESLAAEIGPIVHNAILHHRWEREVRFRAALSRVATLLGGTLELPRVLESVCRESAQLLGSEAAAVFLADPADETVQLASRCLLGVHETPEGHASAPWVDSAEGRALLARLRASGRPLALLKPEPGDGPAPFPLGMPGCSWGALAMFPMFERGRLTALMVVMRAERVQFSSGTLEQGELLAEQVRVAIANARAYEALRHSNDQLRRSEAERMRSERLAVLGEMAASVAHEVRNPLSAINNCLAVLRRGTGSAAPIASAVTIITEEVDRLERLTRNFMSFGRAPRQAAAAARLDELTAYVCDRIRGHLANEGLHVALDVQIRGVYEPILLDPDGFQEVLWNLLLNAVQATGDGGRVRVRLTQRPGRLFLAVADDGPGITRAERTRIFEPFFTRKSQGAGLGLAIVRRHADDWGARLRLWGPPGACFALTWTPPVSAGAGTPAAECAP